MTSEIVDAQREDHQLRLQKRVYVSWNGNCSNYRGKGLVVALDPRIITVELLSPVGRYGEYAAGDLVQVPRYAPHLPKPSNRYISKVPQVPFIHKDFL